MGNRGRGGQRHYHLSDTAVRRCFGVSTVLWSNWRACSCAVAWTTQTASSRQRRSLRRKQTRPRRCWPTPRATATAPSRRRWCCSARRGRRLRPRRLRLRQCRRPTRWRGAACACCGTPEGKTGGASVCDRLVAWRCVGCPAASSWSCRSVAECTISLARSETWTNYRH